MNTKLVDAVLLIDGKTSNYRVELPHEEAREFLKQAGVYNNIPENITGIVGAILEAIGPMDYGLINGRPNPNNGSFRHIRISVGNESSRVIYVNSYRTTFSPSLKMIFSSLESIGQKFEADENECSNKFGTDFFEWRFWWD